MHRGTPITSPAGAQPLKVGIFGGTFSPIHIGHLALANYICEYCALDELWFMVSPQNPMKGASTFLTDEQRLSLVAAAIEHYPKFRVSDFEFTLPRPSYTIRTLDELKKQHPHHEFYLIVGGDNWQTIGRWRESARLIAENNILVYPRPGHTDTDVDYPPTVSPVNAPLLEISSTFIRQALQAGKDVRYFLHPRVWELLEGYQLS